jgi:hypothetical protein
VERFACMIGVMRRLRRIDSHPANRVFQPTILRTEACAGSKPPGYPLVPRAAAAMGSIVAFWLGKSIAGCGTLGRLQRLPVSSNSLRQSIFTCQSSRPTDRGEVST